MNILIIAPVHNEKEFLKQKGKYQFYKYQGQQSWVDAFKNLGHKVFVFRTTDSFLISKKIRMQIYDFFNFFFPRWKARFDRLASKYYFLSLENYFKNTRLISFSKSSRPNIVIISGGISSIYPISIEKIKKKFKCKIYLFSGVNPKTSITSIEKKLLKKNIIDEVIGNDKGYSKFWKRFGAKKSIALPISSVNKEIHKKIKLTKKEKKYFKSDVCFIGTLLKDRQKLLLNLTSYNLKIWGDILPTEKLEKKLRPFYFGKAHGEKMVKAFNASKIVINLQPKDMENGANMRTFEIPGCGSFQIADKVDKDYFVKNKEVVLFNNIANLKKKINFYLNHNLERSKIANAGFKRVRNEHTYEKHFQKII